MPTEPDMNRIRFTNELTTVSGIIKKRFPNLSVDETIKIASEILIALDETIDL